MITVQCPLILRTSHTKLSWYFNPLQASISDDEYIVAPRGNFRVNMFKYDSSIFRTKILPITTFLLSDNHKGEQDGTMVDEGAYSTQPCYT